MTGTLFLVRAFVELSEQTLMTHDALLSLRASYAVIQG